MTIPFRYKRLAYVALNVTDLARSIEFYTTLAGLTMVDSSRHYAALRCSRDHQNLLLFQAAQAGLKRVAFELESTQDLAQAQHYLKSLGLVVEAVGEAELRELRIEAAFRFRLPDCGLCLEFVAGMHTTEAPFVPNPTKIERLGHVVINVPEFERVVAFLTQRLGFCVSDYVPGFVTFLRCFPNPLHHSFAVMVGASNHLNHVNFMVQDIDDIGSAMNRMKRANVEIVFGPGRHQPSESIFLYFLDPDRMTVEYSFGMEQFPEQSARVPRVLEQRADTLDMWGSVPTPAFGKVGAIEQAGAVTP